jgi:hypothetical protein
MTIVVIIQGQKAVAQQVLQLMRTQGLLANCGLPEDKRRKRKEPGT